jgi:hypothetical protein
VNIAPHEEKLRIVPRFEVYITSVGLHACPGLFAMIVFTMIFKDAKVWLITTVAALLVALPGMIAMLYRIPRWYLLSVESVDNFSISAVYVIKGPKKIFDGSWPPRFDQRINGRVVKTTIHNSYMTATLIGVKFARIQSTWEVLRGRLN